MKHYSSIGLSGAVWGLGGVLLLLGSAVWRLSPMALDAFSHPFAWRHWAALIVIILGMAYAEGFRGFQKAFSPRVAARALYLRDHPRPWHVVLAPFFCMGYFHATRRRVITSLSLTAGIILLVILVHFVPQPWRGIIDAGVVVGLAWGLITVAAYGLAALRGGDFPYSPEVPDGRD